jgi:hypothetical protein
MAENGDEPVRVEYRAGDPLSGGLRVRQGADIGVTLHGSPTYGWLPIVGAEGPLVMVSQSVSEGTVEAVLRAQGSGEVELRSTSAFTGDRFGPQTRLWRLTVHVEA